MTMRSNRLIWLASFAAIVGAALFGVNLFTTPAAAQAVEQKGFPSMIPASAWPNSRDAFETKINALLTQFGATDNEMERAKIADDLATLVSEQFDLRQKERATELKELEDQLSQLRKLQDKRTIQKETIVHERAHQLLREADGLGWNDDASRRGGSRLLPGAAPQSKTDMRPR